MSQNETNEAKHQKWKNMRRKEKAMMRLCDDMQVEVTACCEKGQYFDEEYDFFTTRGRSLQNVARMREADGQSDSWLLKAAKKMYNLATQIDKLKGVTAVRKELQEQLGITPTEDEYIGYGHGEDELEDTILFVLLDHELDSTTSVRHYIAESMGGSSLFANEEWRPQMRFARPR
ncbi:hypothetical protein ACET3X_008583 [Alternaria dauci]|uniref:Uncharacterized protein n=1 Tax=Alternaria dauci TaxID=48095 RepID=A0ABR3UAR5_9PLEO